MTIAIPVKTNSDHPALAPLFGKAKWFAFIKDDRISIVKNPAKAGRDVIAWLFDEGVDTIIFQEMGTTPYELIKSKGGIALFHAGHERILLEEVLRHYREGKLAEVDDAAMAEIIARHEGKHSHGSHGHHHGRE
jgi:predicted Fe-Mo cluster-binding NifX family protein